MSAPYLDWLKDVFEEAQVPFDDSTADFLDRTLHAITGVKYPQTREDEVFTIVRQRWLRLGQPGRQLLAALIRDAFYARRDSPHRPKEGGAHFDNSQYKDR